VTDTVICTSANAVLSYRHGGVNLAKVRCSQVGVDYSVNSEESHASQHRAFYPHRRSQGTFSMVIDLKGQAEFNRVMQWFHSYAKIALSPGMVVPPPMSVVVPSRDFNRLGIPTTGIQFGDYIGSMVFSPQVVFLSVSDLKDLSTSILSSRLASTTQEKNADPATKYFYPDSYTSGKVARLLYDETQARKDAADLQAALGPSHETTVYGAPGGPNQSKSRSD
jgi:hypothetical protein